MTMPADISKGPWDRLIGTESRRSSTDGDSYEVKIKRKEIVSVNLDLSFVSGFVLGFESGLPGVG
jgi:hypothetical protein